MSLKLPVLFLHTISKMFLTRISPILGPYVFSYSDVRSRRERRHQNFLCCHFVSTKIIEIRRMDAAYGYRCRTCRGLCVCVGVFWAPMSPA